MSQGVEDISLFPTGGPRTWDAGEGAREPVLRKEPPAGPQTGPPLCLHKEPGLSFGVTTSRMQSSLWRDPGPVPPPLPGAGLSRFCKVRAGTGGRHKEQRGTLCHFHRVTCPPRWKVGSLSIYRFSVTEGLLLPTPSIKRIFTAGMKDGTYLSLIHI